MKSFGISSAIEAVAGSLQTGDWNDLPKIRTALNDTLDAADKDGYRVRFDYDQARAVRIVQRRLKGGAR